MREIKFRGLRTDGRGWIYGSIVYPDKLIRGLWMLPEVNMCDFYPDLEDGEKIESHEHQGIIIGRFIEVIPESVGQYTGILDSNNREIYEGDIIKYYDNNTTEEVKFEIFDTEQGYFINTDYTRLVLGNIHQQPCF